MHRCFVPWTHRNALRDLQIPRDTKTQVQRNVSRRAFYGNRTSYTRTLKKCVDDSHPGRTRMHFVTHRFHGMQKHKFSVICPGVLFMESTLVPPLHEKWCVDISRPVRTGMHYVTRRSHRMQKHKVGVMCPSSLFMEAAPGPPEHEK
jgi:hypothetical protein